MNKKKILICGEASFLNTGYSNYVNGVLNYLYNTGKYELAELASYGQRNDPRGLSLPWKYYGVQPNEDYEPKATKEEKKAYYSKSSNQFGEFIFEHVCLDFQPDIVFDMRDYWQLEFSSRSPFRPYFHQVLMPTVDAEPQARQWIETYSDADAIFTYSEWAGDLLQRQSGNKVNYIGTAPPSPSSAYRPLDKDVCRRELNINPESKIIGTVMRNQRRKLYPDLFYAFRKFLDTTQDNNYFLYCHTAYPDLGWDIPELLLTHGISSNVLFTYICRDTNRVFAKCYSGPITKSPFTDNFNAVMCNVRHGASEEQLSTIINSFDLYVQYANSEGFGIPIVEAAACAIPVVGIDYSAMSSVLKNIDGARLKPLAFYKELETGCHRAVPNNQEFVEYLNFFFSLNEEQIKYFKEDILHGYNKHYGLKKTGKKLETYFDSVQPKSWTLPPRIFEPSEKLESYDKMTYKDIARWLILNVVKEPERINTYFEARLIRDLTYGTRTAITGGIYENESSAAFEGKINRVPFNPDIAYEEMKKISDKRNYWEKRRYESLVSSTLS